MYMVNFVQKSNIPNCVCPFNFKVEKVLVEGSCLIQTLFKLIIPLSNPEDQQITSEIGHHLTR
jgi:hypothetical protein